MKSSHISQDVSHFQVARPVQVSKAKLTTGSRLSGGVRSVTTATGQGGQSVISAGHQKETGRSLTCTTEN